MKIIIIIISFFYSYLFHALGVTHGRYTVVTSMIKFIKFADFVCRSTLFTGSGLSQAGVSTTRRFVLYTICWICFVSDPSKEKCQCQQNLPGRWQRRLARIWQLWTVFPCQLREVSLPICLSLIKSSDLVFTKSVDSSFRAFRLAPVTWNIPGYSLFCERREKWRVVSRKFQKKKCI